MFYFPFHDKIKKKGGFTMLRRYELTDEEWLRIEPLLPPENTGKQGRPRKMDRLYHEK